MADGGWTWPLRQRWFWTLFLVLLVTLVGAFAIVFLIISLSPSSLFLMLIVVLVLWFVLRSYRKWSASKPDEEREGQKGGESENFLDRFD